LRLDISMHLTLWLTPRLKLSWMILLAVKVLQADMVKNQSMVTFIAQGQSQHSNM